MEVKSKTIRIFEGITLNKEECKIIAELIEKNTNERGKTDGFSEKQDTFLDELHDLITVNLGGVDEYV